MSATSRIYGFDFGTLYSRIATVSDTSGQAELIGSRDDGFAVPSVVYFEKDNPEPVIGKNAKRWAHVAPSLVCSDVKHHIGEPDWHFQPRDEDFCAEEIVADILRSVITEALESNRATTDSEVSVVLSVPVYFGSAERHSLRAAARLARLDVKELVADPVAAVFEWGAPLYDKPENILVCDLGATCQASVLATGGGRLSIIAISFDRHFGGADWDRALVERFCGMVDQENDPDLASPPKPEVAQQLFDAAERAKISLSAADRTMMSVRTAARAHSLDITLADFEALTAELNERATRIARDAVMRAQSRGVVRIDKLLLVGGTSQIPSIRRRFENEFGLSTQLREPALAVVRGAAQIADLVRRGLSVPADLSFEQAPGDASPLHQRTAHMNSTSCCGTVLPHDARFCPLCGKPVGTSCRACGRELQTAASFCQYCGTARNRAGTDGHRETRSTHSPTTEEGRDHVSDGARPPSVPARQAAAKAEELLRAEAERREREEEERLREAAEIVPGTWRQVPTNGSPEVLWTLGGDGAFIGILRATSGLPPGLGGMLPGSSMEIRIDLSGTWIYDYKAHVLAFDGSAVQDTQFIGTGTNVPPMPIGLFNRRFRIVGGSRDNWEAVAEDDGSRHRFVRTLTI